MEMEFEEERGVLGLTRTELYSLLVPLGFILLLIRYNLPTLTLPLSHSSL